MSTPQWVHLGTFTNNSFNAAATNLTIPSAFVLPANWVVHNTWLILTTAFVGGGVLGYNIEVGNLLLPAKYLPPQFVGVLPPSPIQPVSIAGIEGAGTTSPLLGTPLQITASCSAGTLNNATQGTCDIWMFISSLTN